MDFEALLRRVVAEYFQARPPRRPHERIVRGESRSISGYTEDHFAFHVAEAYPAIGRIFINQPLSYTTDGKDYQIKPDLALCCDDQIRMFIDLKMDMGYMRDSFPTTAAKRAEQIQLLRGKTVSLKEKDANGRKLPKKLRVSPDILYVYVVVTDRNISKAKFARNVASVDAIPELRLFTLVKGIHPNLYDVTQLDTEDQIVEALNHDDCESLATLLARAADSSPLTISGCPCDERGAESPRVGRHPPQEQGLGNPLSAS